MHSSVPNSVMAERISVTIVVPTYARTQSLSRCVQGVLAQISKRDTIVISRRADDAVAARVLAGNRPTSSVLEVIAAESSHMGQLLGALQSAEGDVVAFIDDDAVPRPGWLARIRSWFVDPAVGAVGGRDVIPGFQDAKGADEVGVISPWGRLKGNHHVGGGKPRPVKALKGVNMAFRREALAIPIGLRGAGNQPHHEIASCGWARKRGWKLVYDPSLLVDHFPAARLEGEDRVLPGRAAARDSAYNLVACLLAAEPDLFWRRALYGVLVGDRATPGFARAIRGLLRGESEVFGRLVPSLSGQLAALRDAATGRHIEMADRWSHDRSRRVAV